MHIRRILWLGRLSNMSKVAHLIRAGKIREATLVQVEKSLV
jgi:hypothetical protein